MVRSRPCLYTISSDYHEDGALREVGSTNPHTLVLWDRRLFPVVRRRVARWVHNTLNDGLASAYVDPHFVGRRGHAVETNKSVAVAVFGVKSNKLDRKESDPLERMAEDAARVSIVTTARNGRAIGVPGGHDGYWLHAYQQTNKPAWATRHGARGCPGCCKPDPPPNICAQCDGWQLRTTRRNRRLHPLAMCTTCGGARATQRETPQQGTGWPDGYRGSRTQMGEGRARMSTRVHGQALLGWHRPRSNAFCVREDR